MHVMRKLLRTKGGYRYKGVWPDALESTIASQKDVEKDEKLLKANSGRRFPLGEIPPGSDGMAERAFRISPSRAKRPSRIVYTNGASWNFQLPTVRRTVLLFACGREVPIRSRMDHVQEKNPGWQREA